MIDNFEQFITEVLEVEGGFVNDPDDRGGATNMGVTFRVYEEYYREKYDLNSGPEDFIEMTLKEATDIYRYFYWDRVSADELPSGLDLLVADMAVNSGVSRASKCLQKAVNAKQDGFIGPKTLAKTKAMGANVLIHKVFLLRREFYFTIASINNNIKFYKGWINRLNKIYDATHTLVYGE